MATKGQRVGVFVDVANMYYSAKNIHGTRVNFGKLLEEATGDRQLVRALAYVIKADSPDENRFFEALDKQGFELKQKDLQVFEKKKKKGDWDVGITVEMIAMADKLDVMVLVAGDGDYVPLVQYLKIAKGCRVEIMAFSESTSQKLRESGDMFIDLSGDKKKYLLPMRGALRPSLPRPRFLKRNDESPLAMNEQPEPSSDTSEDDYFPSDPK